MSLQAAFSGGDVRHDGFGSRSTTDDAQFGRVDVLDLTSALGTPAAEQAIRAAAARVAAAALRGLPFLRSMLPVPGAN